MTPPDQKPPQSEARVDELLCECPAPKEMTFGGFHLEGTRIICNKCHRPKSKAEHEWIEFDGLPCCKICGIVRRADYTNKPCKGPVQIKFRETGEFIVEGVCVICGEQNALNQGICGKHGDEVAQAYLFGFADGKATLPASPAKTDSREGWLTSEQIEGFLRTTKDWVDTAPAEPVSVKSLRMICDMALSALSSQAKPETGWMPIETAPKKVTVQIARWDGKEWEQETGWVEDWMDVFANKDMRWQPLPPSPPKPTELK